VTAPQVTAGIEALKRAALATGQMHEPISVDISESRRAARVQIPFAGDGTDAASNRALETLRGNVIPSTIGRVDGAAAYVTGRRARARLPGRALRVAAQLPVIRRRDDLAAAVPVPPRAS
jgi:RND superfamily putative drug exporter